MVFVMVLSAQFVMHTETLLYSTAVCVCVCVHVSMSVCVCVCERERDYTWQAVVLQ